MGVKIGTKGFLEWVLGDSSAGGLKTEQLRKWSPEQQELFGNLSNIVQSRLGKPAPSYPGQMVAPTTKQEKGYVEGGKYGEALSKALKGQMYGPEQTEGAIKAMKPVYEQAFTDVEDKIKAARGGRPGYQSWGTERAFSEAFADIGAQKAQHEASLWDQYRQMNTEATRGAIPLAMEDEAKRAEASRGIAQNQLAEDLMRWQSGEEVDGQFDPMAGSHINLIMQMLQLQPYEYASGMRPDDKGLIREFLG